MNRRDFATLLPFLWSSSRLSGQLQQRQGMRRIGALLLLVEDGLGRSRLGAFQQTLRILGWTAGQNIQIDVRWAGDDAARAEAYASELVRTKPDVIFALGTASVQALMKETREIPIVFALVTDPVEAGFVKSLSSPGRNVTGFANFGPSVGGERLGS
jgi:putative ABC transport system substrate-binding protein